MHEKIHIQVFVTCHNFVCIVTYTRGSRGEILFGRLTYTITFCYIIVWGKPG